MIKKRRERVWKKCGAKRRYQIVFKKVEILEIVQIKHTYCTFWNVLSNRTVLKKQVMFLRLLLRRRKYFLRKNLLTSFFVLFGIFSSFCSGLFSYFVWFFFDFASDFSFYFFPFYFGFFFNFFFFNFKETFASAFHVKLYQIGVRIVGCHCY